MTPATATPMRTRTGPIPTQIHEPAIEVAGRLAPRYDEILTPEALAFLTDLHHRFGARRHDRLADRMRRRGLRVTTSVAVDAQAGHGILSEADAVGCDLIAMATHGRSGMGRMVLGSAADKVLRGTHVPLLLFRPAKVPAVKL